MKRKFIKALKNAGIRNADKNGATVGIKHLKISQAIKLCFENNLLVR